MMTAVGIDLGTTNSAIAFIDEFGKPNIIQNELGETITPSVICFEPNHTTFGSPAKELQALGTYPVAAWFKRKMGDKSYGFFANNKDYTATELSALLLKHVIKQAERRIKKPIKSAVITVPAYFKETERNATIKAGKMAGIKVLQVINEPTAAAVAFGLNKERKKQTLLVYDLGGGTFDVSLLRIEKDQIKILNADGDHHLGGKDWDDRIIHYLATQFEQEYGCDPLEDAESVAELLVQAEAAKKQLTQFEKTSVSITHDGNRGRYSLTRKIFEELTGDLLQRTAALTRQVLSEKRIRPKQLSGILLVGGSTRMPMVRRFLEKDLGARILHGVNVDEAVALGAAMVAAERLNEPSFSIFSLPGVKRAEKQKSEEPVPIPSPRKTVDVTNHSLGMIAVNADNSAYINTIILPKNTTIPCSQKRPYQLQGQQKNDNTLEIFLTQGESEDPANASYIGKYLVKDVPKYSGKSTILDIHYQYDQSATVKVSAFDRISKKSLNVSVDSVPKDVPQRFLKPPKIERVIEPMTAYLAFDMSGSMSGEPLQAAKKAAMSFLNNIDLRHCSIGIIAFSDTVKTALSATHNSKKIQQAIESLTEGETGYCNDAHPFDQLHDLLKNVNGNRYGIVLADGVWCYQESAIKQAKQCHKSNIDIIAIGFGSADKSFLEAIASASESAFFTSMEGLEDTFSGIAQVLTESGGSKSLSVTASLKSDIKKSSKGLLSRLFS